MTDLLPDPLCEECAAEMDEEYKQGPPIHTRSQPRIGSRCENCQRKLGKIFRPKDKGPYRR